MLGMYLALDRNIRNQVKYLKTEALTWETSIRSCGIQNDESWHTLKLTISHTLIYPLIEMTLTYK